MTAEARRFKGRPRASRETVATLLWFVVGICGAICVLVSPMKASFITERSLVQGTWSSYTTGMAAWGVWSFLAGVSVLALLALAGWLATTQLQLLAILPLAAIVAILVRLAVFSRDYRADIHDRAASQGWELIAAGPSGIVAALAIAGALAAILLMVPLIGAVFRRRSTRLQRTA